MYSPRFNFFHYSPQRSWGKVMFLQASVILLTGGVCLSACWDTPQEQTPHWSKHPQEQTSHPPGSRHTPRSRSPQEQTPPGSRHPREQTSPWEQTPPRSRHPPGSRQPPSTEHAGRYGQRAGDTLPTGMQSCFDTIFSKNLAK